MDYADLELGIHQYMEQSYRVDFRLSLPSFDADIRAASRKPIGVQFDFSRLLEVTNLPEYGQRLTEQLFSDVSLRVAFARARALAAQDSKPLRLRLYIGPSAQKLQELHWETLR